MKFGLIITIGMAVGLCLPAASFGAGAARNGPECQGRRAHRLDRGHWVSVVTEDWRYRMLIALKGDYHSIPLTPGSAGRWPTRGTLPKTWPKGNNAWLVARPPFMRTAGAGYISLGTTMY